MFRRPLTASLLVVALLGSAVAAPSASAADPFTEAIKTWQRQWTRQWNDMVKKITVQWQDAWKSLWIKQGVDPTAPYVAKGFTVELPIGEPGVYVGGLGVNSTGTGGAVAVGPALVGPGSLYLLDTLKKTAVEVPKPVALPFDGANSVSLDGKRVVFINGIGPFARPFAFARGTEEAVQLSSKVTSQPTISTDGKTYAVAADGGLLGKDTVEIGDPTIGEPTVIASGSSISQTLGRPQISGDGRYVGFLAWTTSTTTFRQYDTKTDTTTIVDLDTKDLPTGGSPELTDWSWDLRRLLITRTVSGKRTAYVVDLKGTTRTVTTLPGKVGGESPPTLRADSAAIGVATPTPMDSSDTNSAVDLGWVNLAGTKYERQSFDADGLQLPGGIGLVPFGGRVPRFAMADTGVASFWVSPASEGGGESVYVRTTLPVLNTVPTTVTAN